MRIVFLSLGSRGDTAPIIRLALALKKKGYKVMVVATTDSKELIESLGLEFYSAKMNTREALQTPLGQKLLNAQGNGLKALKAWRNIVNTFVGNLPQLCWDAVQSFNPDLIVFSLSTFAGHSVGEALGIPSACVSFFPNTPTKSFPVFMFRGDFGGRLNYFSYKFFEFFYEKFVLGGDKINPWRKKLGLKPYKGGAFTYMRKQDVPQLYMVSPNLFPKPSDWSSNDHQTGYWHLDEPGWQPEQALLDFLEAGPEPVYFGFGSMAIKEPQRVTTTILKALSITGQRAIIAKGWGGIGEGVELPDNIYLVGETSHEWLFERVSAIIHHGGCGTTHSALRAGKPTLIIPFTSDQPWWGHAIYKKGIGPKPIPIKKLTPENLAQALMAMTDTGMIERARQNGVKVRVEGGAEKAAAVIEEVLNNIPKKILATA